MKDERLAPESQSPGRLRPLSKNPRTAVPLLIPPPRRPALSSAHCWLAIAVAAVMAAGCTAAPERPEAPPAPTPAKVSAAQFASLAWLEGRWRGVDAGGAAFYESYAVVSPTLIRSFTYSDSLFGTPNDSGALELRGDTLLSGSPAMQWVVTYADSAQWRFAPWRAASNAFTWERVAADTWTATLRWDSAGVPKERVYRMTAVR